MNLSLDSLTNYTIQQRWIVIILLLMLAIFGGYNATQVSVDAVPDITNVQVQINVTLGGMSPAETEQRLTVPIETAMRGLPNLEKTWSISRYGFSQTTVIFEDGTDIYFARQLINDRLSSVRNQLPAESELSLGPISTGLGEIFMWAILANKNAIKSDGTTYSIFDLRELQDWVIKPQMREVKGVTEVNTIGGDERQIEIQIQPDKLLSYHLDMQDIQNAVESNIQTVGAGALEKNSQLILVRSMGSLGQERDLLNIPIKTIDGQVITLGQVAILADGANVRTGAATLNGQEAVIGTTFMLIGENSRTVAQAARLKLTEISKAMPKGVQLMPIYDRTVLVDNTIETVIKSLIEGALLVIIVLFLILGNLRAALITALMIPMTLLCLFIGMNGAKISANLMSMGALDFGLIVDGAVVLVENSLRRLAVLPKAADRQQRLQTVFEAAAETRRPLIYGQLIIMVVYIPIFALQGVEAKLFHPMAWTVVLALIAALLLSLTLMPALIALTLTNQIIPKHTENNFFTKLQKKYEVFLEFMLNKSTIIFSFVLILLIIGAGLSTRLGTEFVPSLDEHDKLIETIAISGMNTREMQNITQKMQIALIKLPEVHQVFAKIGTPEIASDAMPPHTADVFVMLKPRDQWDNPELMPEELGEKLLTALANIPGANFGLTQPIEMRFNELIAGVRSDVAVMVYGSTEKERMNSAKKIAQILTKIQGSTDVQIEQTDGLPMLSIEPKRDVLARYGVSLAQIQNVLKTSIAGNVVGMFFKEDRRFEIVMRLPPAMKQDMVALGQLPVVLPNGNTLPLHIFADIKIQSTPFQISRENGQRRITVSANIRGRDLGGFVAEAQQNVEKNVPLSVGEWRKWGGSFEQLERVMVRLQLVVPLALLCVFILLYLMFGTWRDGLIVFSGVPFALVGGVFALWLRDMPLSVSAAIGFIALSGVSVLNGLVLVQFIRDLLNNKMALELAIIQGASARLRAVLMTAFVASLGFVPMAIAIGSGAEVQRPLATVVIGGIISSTVLTLIVLPVLYHRFAGKNTNKLS